jgi:glycoside/pentoside/hexuronide:cation symporter, GPH family
MGLSLRHKLGWGIGSLGVAILFNTQTVLLTRFMTDELGIAAAAAGTLLALTKLYDAFTDPLMGWISDHTRSRWGRRRPWLLLGGLGSACAFAFLFNPPDSLSPTVAIVVGLLAYATFYTIFNVPYMAMPAEMSTDPAERTKLVSWRVKAIGVGQLIGAALAPMLVYWLGGGLAGYGSMAQILGTIAAVALVLCFFGTRGVRETQRQEQTAGFRETLAVLKNNRPFVLLVCTKLLQLSGVAVSLAAMAYLFREGLGRDFRDLGTYFAVNSVGVILVQPLWVRLARHGGKAKLYAVAALGFALVGLSWFLAGPDTTMTGIVVRSAISAVFVGGLLLMGQAMLPDTIHYDWQHSGKRREGIFAGIYTTVEKLSFALGGVFAGFILQWYGYQSSVSGQVVVQTEEAVRGIYVLAAAAPAVLMLLSCIPLMLYPLKESELRQESHHAAQ